MHKILSIYLVNEKNEFYIVYFAREDAPCDYLTDFIYLENPDHTEFLHILPIYLYLYGLTFIKKIL